MYKRNSSQIIVILVIIATLASCGIYFYKQHQASTVKQPQNIGINVEVERVRTGSLSRNIQVVGILEANNSVTIKAQVRGLVTQVFFKGGEEVKAGDKIFTLDNRSYKAVSKEAEANQVLATFEYKRAQQLHQKNFSSQKIIDKAKSDFLRAEANYEKAQKELDDTVIIAPYEGVISLHKISIGALVGPDTELLKITDVNPMKVDFKVPAKFYSYLNVGQTVEVIVDSVPDKTFEGEIEAIDSQVDASAQQIAVRSTVSNEAHILKPGLLAKIKINVGSKDNSLIVPAEAVESSGDQNYVYKVIEHPEHPGVYIVFKVPITLGISEGESVEITRGIYDNDIVVTVGQQKLKDGYPVKFDLDSINSNENKSEIEIPVITNSAAPSKKVNDQSSWWLNIKHKVTDLFSVNKKNQPLEKVKQKEVVKATKVDAKKSNANKNKLESDSSDMDKFVDNLTKPKTKSSFASNEIKTQDTSIQESASESAKKTIDKNHDN